MRQSMSSSGSNRVCVASQNVPAAAWSTASAIASMRAAWARSKSEETVAGASSSTSSRVGASFKEHSDRARARWSMPIHSCSAQ